MVCVPPAAIEPVEVIIIGEPPPTDVKVRLLNASAGVTVMVLPTVAAAATSAVTQKYPVLLALITCDKEVND